MKFTRNKIAQIILLILFTCNIFATNTSTEEEIFSVVDPGVDPGATPVDTYILPMLILGIALGYRLMKKKIEITN
jgi:hypothetical protein